MKIYQSLPAPQTTSKWLENLLLPVITACNFETPIPLELRPCGEWGGFCQSEKYLSDRRVYLNSTRVSFWEKRGVVSSYLHECTHRIIGIDHGHDAVFFALQYLLFLRTEPLHHITQDPSLYDLQDIDPAELGASIDWSIQAATELANTTKTAEQCAGLLASAYSTHIDAWREAPHKAAQQAQQQRATHAAALSQWRDRRDAWQAVAMAATGVALAGWAGFLILINR